MPARRRGAALAVPRRGSSSRVDGGAERLARIRPGGAAAAPPRSRTSPTSAASRGAAGARDRARGRARDAPRRAARGRARRCSPGRSPGCCRRSTTTPALAATIVASAAGEGPVRALAPPATRPSTASHAVVRGDGRRRAAAVAGRGDPGRPGVLFLDELPEFGRDVLEALRQPLEDGACRSRGPAASTTFPARFQLVAAMNPCPCGYAGDRRALPLPARSPSATPAGSRGPLRDRIDLWVTMPRVAPAALVGGREPESSHDRSRRGSPRRGPRRRDRGAAG